MSDEPITLKHVIWADMNKHVASDIDRMLMLDDSQIFHVYPTFGREHITNQRYSCWCAPRVDLVEEGAIVIHEAEQ